jgi:hypothetical protein
MKAKVIAAFPGTGKSYYVSRLKQGAKIIDLDTGEYTLGIE